MGFRGFLALLLLAACVRAQDDPFRKWLESLTIHIPTVSFVEGGVNVTLASLTCHGLDFTAITSDYKPPITLDMGIAGLSISCGGLWDAFDVNHPFVSGHGNVTLVVDESSLSATIELDRDSKGLAIAAKLPKSSVKIHIKTIHFTGTGAAILDGILDLIKGALAGVIDIGVEVELKHLVETNLTRVLGKVNTRIQPFLGPVTPDPPPPVPPGSMSLYDNKLIKLLDKVLDTSLGAKGLNKIMDLLTHNSGVLAVRNMTRAHVTVPEPFGTIEFGLASFELAGLDSWTDFDLFRPIGNYTMASHTSMRSLSLNVTFYVNVTEAGALSGGWLYEEAQFFFNLTDCALSSQAQLTLNEAVIDSLYGTQFGDGACIQDAVTGMNITMLTLNTTVRDISLRAMGGKAEEDLDQFVNNLLALFIGGFDTAIPAFLDGIINMEVRGLINTKVSDALHVNITGECEPAKFDTDYSVFAAVTSFSCTLTAALLIFLLSQYVHRRFFSTSDDRRSKALMSINDDDPSESTSLIKRQYPPALIVHPDIPAFLRFGVVILIWGTIGMLIFSNNSVGAAVHIVLTVGDKSNILPSIFQFTLANSVHDMWVAGVYPLSIMIAVLSGAWPYLKLLIMQFCWVMPTQHLSPERRETIFMVIDALGKWSLIDAFIMVMMLVAFRFHIASPDGSAIADVIVDPGMGIYTFVIGTMSSLFITHLCLNLDRRVSHPQAVLQLELDEKEALCNHHSKIGGRLARFTRKGKAFLPLLILISIGTLILGVIIESFNFEFQGAAALVLELTGTSTERGYSLISLGQDMPSTAANPNSVGVRFLQGVFFLFSIGMPLAHLTSMMIIWLVPLTLRQQHSLFVAVEVFNAWSALDVFVIAIIATLVELQQFAQFIIGDKCDAINVLLQKYFDKPLGGHDVCFNVIANLSKGCWVLFVSAFIAVVCAVFITKTCHGALMERTRLLERRHSVSSGGSDDDQKKTCGCCGCCNRISLLYFWLGLVEEEHIV